MLYVHLTYLTTKLLTSHHDQMSLRDLKKGGFKNHNFNISMCQFFDWDRIGFHLNKTMKQLKISNKIPGFLGALLNSSGSKYWSDK